MLVDLRTSEMRQLEEELSTIKAVNFPTPTPPNHLTHTHKHTENFDKADAGITNP